MEVLERIINDLKDLRRDLVDGSIAREIIEEHEFEIIEKNQNQLSHGLDSNGQPIRPEYTETTKAIKRSKGQPDDRVTLFDKGPFYKGIEVDLFSEKFEMIGTDPKTDKLVGKYGEVLGLTDQSKIELVDEVFRPRSIDKIRERLQLA